MKNLKRILSFMLVALMVLSFVGCHKKDEIAVTIGDVEFTSAYYMCALINADSQAKNIVYEALTEDEKNGKTEYDIYSKKVEGKDYVKWVEETAMNNLKETAAYKILCKENKLDLDDEMTNQFNLYSDYYWQNGSAYYELNGVGEQTYKNFMKDGYYSELYFEHLYAKDGEKEIKADDVKEKIYSSFITANILEANFTSEMKDEDKTALKEKIDAYAKDLKDGKKTFKQVYNDYNGVKEEESHEGHDHTSSTTTSATSSVASTTSTTASSTSSGTTKEEEVKKPKDEYAAVIGDEGTGYESDQYKDIKEMKTGEIKVIEVKDVGYILVIKQDITADDYYLDYLDMNARHLLKDDEFKKTMDEYIKKLTADVNDYAVDQFEVKKIKEPEIVY